jgi:hypothetical protein
MSDMLRHLSNGSYLEAVRMAERTVLHIEVLFATIDDLVWHFARLGAKGMILKSRRPISQLLLQKCHTSENLVFLAEKW